VAWLGKRFAKAYIKAKLKVEEIELSDAELDILRKLKGKRTLLMPSHSGGFEPYLIIYISKLLHDSYFYLAAIEAFQRNIISAWIMPRMGAYSIIRGTADRASFQMTKKILSEGKRWLVIFPEGQTVWQNDTVISFQEGVTQMAFKALEDANNRTKTENSLFCIPIAIKYTYLKNMDAEINESLQRLESQFFVEPPQNDDSALTRLRRISEAMLVINERKHKVPCDESKSLDERIQQMKETVVSKIEQRLNLAPRKEQILLDRIRSCFNAIDNMLAEEAPPTPYERKLFDERNNNLRPLYDDLWRVLQLVAIYEEYVSEKLTTERFLDVLCLLEMEAFNERRMWGPRRAIIRVGTPIDLKDHFSAYKANKRSTIKEVSDSLENSVKEMLAEIADQHSLPLPSTFHS
jgi:hypothetical protein